MSEDRFYQQGLNIYNGLDGASDAASINDGYLMEAENVDFSYAGVIRKRLGYNIVGGDFPIRAKRISNGSIELDSQPVITVSGVLHPFDTSLQSIITEYSLGITDFKSTFSVLEITTDVQINYMDSDILFGINGVTEASLKKYKPVFALTDTLIVVSNELIYEMGLDPSISAPFSDLIVYKGYTLPKVNSKVLSVVQDISYAITITFEDNHNLLSGSQVYIDTLFRTGTFTCVSGTISVIDDKIIQVYYDTSYEARTANGVENFEWLNIYYSFPTTVDIRRSSSNKGDYLLDSITGINRIYVNLSSQVGLMWVWGLGITPPVTGLTKFKDNELIATCQNWAFVWKDVKTPIKQATPISMPTTETLKIMRGLGSPVLTEVARGRLRAGDYIYWQNLDDSMEIADPRIFKVNRIRSNDIVIESADGYLTIPAKSRILFRTVRDSIYASEYLPVGSMITVNNQTVKVVANRFTSAGTLSVLSESISYSSTDTILLAQQWEPLNISGDDLFPYTGLNPSAYITDLIKVSTAEYADRVYLSYGEGGIWRYNGRNLTNMRWGAPPMPTVRRLINVPGSITVKGSTSEGFMASEVKIAVNYGWEDFDGKIFESTYINWEDLTIRPNITDSNDAEQIEICIPTFPGNLGIPADKVKIRVYALEDSAEDTFLSLVTEVDNLPNQTYVIATIGDRFNKFFTNASDLALTSALNDSPMMAPRCSGIVASENRLIAYNTLSESSVEFSCDKVFKDDDTAQIETTVITYEPILGNKYEFVGQTSGLGWVGVTPKPLARGLKLYQAQYIDTSDIIHLTMPLVSGGSVLLATPKLSNVRQRALVSTLGPIKSNIDFNETLFTLGNKINPTDISNPAAPPATNYLVSPVKNRDTDFLREINPDAKGMLFYEILDSTGKYETKDPCIMISGGKLFLCIDPDEFTDIMTNNVTFGAFRVYFKNDADRTLGNLRDNNTGKVLDWNRDVIFGFTLGANIIFDDGVLSGKAYHGYPLVLVNIQNDPAAYLKLADDNFKATIDVTHAEGGLKHGGFSLFASYLTLNSGASTYKIDTAIGDTKASPSSWRRYFIKDANTKIDGIYVSYDDSFPFYSTFLEPGLNDKLLVKWLTTDANNSSNFTIFTSGTKVKVKLFDSNDSPIKHEPGKGMINLDQEFEVVSGIYGSWVDNANARGIILKALKPPIETYLDQKEVKLDVATSAYAEMWLSDMDIEITPNYFSVPVDPDVYLGSAEWKNVLAGDWVFVILAGTSVDEVYLEYSGWFQLYENIPLSSSFSSIKLSKPDSGNIPRGFNTLRESYVLLGSSDITLPVGSGKYVPVPLPSKPHSYGRRFDYAYPLFSRTLDEGNNAFNSVIARFAMAINTVLRDKVTARWGSSPTGDIISDIYPANGMQIIPHTLVNRYTEVNTNFTLNKIEIDLAKYTTPTDKWTVKNLPTVTSEFWRAFGVNISTNETGTFSTQKTSSFSITYSDRVLDSTIYWTISQTDSLTRLPVFGFVTTETVGKEDNEPITGAIRWQDMVIISKPSSMWGIQIAYNKDSGDTVRKTRLQVPEGSKSGQMVATESEVYFTGNTGIWKTTGTDSEKVKVLDRYFKERVLPSYSYLPIASSSYDSLSRTVYLGVPYATEGVSSLPNARFKLDVTTSAWSVDTALYVSQYAYIGFKEFYGSYLGNVLQKRTEGEINAHSDVLDNIAFKIRTRYSDTDSAFKVKFFRNMYLLLGEDAPTTIRIGVAYDFKRFIDGEYTSVNIKPDVAGVSFGTESFGGSRYIADFRVSTMPRFSHISIQLTNNDRNPVEVFAIFLESLRVTGKTKDEPVSRS